MKEEQLREIEAFLKGELSEEDQQGVKRKMEEDQRFEAAVEEMKDLHLLVNIAGDTALKEKFEQIGEEVTTEKRKLSFGVRAFFIIGFVVMCVIGMYFLIEKTSPKKDTSNPDTIYASYFEPYRSPSTVRGEPLGSSPDKLWAEAISHYNDEEYEKAKKKWETYAETLEKEDYLTNFYIGMSSLGSENTQEAISALQKVLTTDNDFRQQTQWYLALAYLKIQNPEAKTLLEEIVKMENHYKKEAAKEILEMIND